LNKEEELNKIEELKREYLELLSELKLRYINELDNGNNGGRTARSPSSNIEDIDGDDCEEECDDELDDEYLEEDDFGSRPIHNLSSKRGIGASRK